MYHARVRVPQNHQVWGTILKVFDWVARGITVRQRQAPKERYVGRAQMLATLTLLALAIVSGAVVLQRFKGPPDPSPPTVKELLGTIDEIVSGKRREPPRTLSTDLVLETELVWHVSGYDEHAVSQGPRGVSYQIGPIGAVVIGNDTSVFVSQPSDASIAQFGLSGALTRIIGGPGEGPGESGAVSAFGLTGDSLFVSDATHFRVSFFTANGEFLGARPWVSDIPLQPVGPGMFMAASVPSAIRPDGVAVIQPNLVAVPSPAVVGVQEGGVRIPILSLDPIRSVIDTVAWDERAGSLFGMIHRGRIFQIAIPWENSAHTVIVPNGRGAIGVRPSLIDDSTIVVTRYRTDGEVAFSRDYHYVPLPTTPEAVRRTLVGVSVLPGDVEGAPAGTDFEGALRSAGIVPKTLPPVTDVVVGQDESIWLRREETAADHILWTQLDPFGVEVGSLALPRTHQIRAVLGTVLIVVAQDELGVPSILRYRLGMSR